MTVPTILNLISTTVVVVGAVLALLQLRHFAKERSRESALQMLHSFQTPEFLTAVNLVFELPEGFSKKEIEDRLGDKITCVLVMMGTFESLGILVFRRDMDIRLIEDFFSGVIILAGRKLKGYLSEMRETSGRPTYYEWFQWLYEQFEKREAKAPVIPSFVEFRDWAE